MIWHSKIRWRWFFIIVVLALAVNFGYLATLRLTLPVQAQENSEGDDAHLKELQKTIDDLRGKISEIQSEKNTLANAIKVLESKVFLNEAEIEKTQQEILLLEKQIVDLSQRISGLELSLGELSEMLVQRIQKQYKQSYLDPLTSLLGAGGLSGFVRDQRYLQQTRSHTEDIMLTTEWKRQVYDEQKQEKEVKQAQVLSLQQKLKQQQADLEQQKRDKQTLLSVTQNNEKTYQTKLSQALAEFQAIQSIIAGRGEETKVGSVTKGQTIASIIPGSSVCSTGAHLHFEVVKGGAHNNPAGYLKSVDVAWQDSPFSFSGGWDWPVNNPAIVTQGYGMTSFARTGFYGGSGHTGIDLVSKTSGSWGVLAVQDGELFRGSIRCGGGNLRYVRVKQSDDISTYYLHVNY